MRTEIFLDEIDASLAARAWISSLARACAHPSEIRSDRFEHDGGAVSLWVRGRLVAISVILRDDANRSVLANCEVSAEAR